MNKLYRTIRGYIDDFIFSFSQNRKPGLKYLACIIPASIYLGMICFIGKNTGADSFIKSLQGFAFIFAGLFHLYLLSKKISFHRLEVSGEGIIYTLFLSVVICITLLLFYLFTDNSMAVMAIVSGAAFALPHIFLHAWFLYKNIPSKEYPLWTKPSDTRDINELLMPEIITFKFLLAAKKDERPENEFFKTIPIEWKLGRVFYSIFDDYDIEYKDEEGNLYAWEFYTFSFNGLIKKRLEPEDTLSDNSITHNSVIHVRRAKLSTTPVVHTIQYKTISKKANSRRLPVKKLANISANKEEVLQ